MAAVTQLCFGFFLWHCSEAVLFKTSQFDLLLRSMSSLCALAQDGKLFGLSGFPCNVSSSEGRFVIASGLGLVGGEVYPFLHATAACHKGKNLL